MHSSKNPKLTERGWRTHVRIGYAFRAILVLFATHVLVFAADKSGVSPNSISLPKGPGSIEGLGESFQPTLNTGTAKYGLGIKLPPGTAGHQPSLALSYVAFSLALSVVMGMWRGVKITVWQDAAGRWMNQGNRTTIALWGALIGAKVAMGTVASITGWFPAQHAGDVFLFLAFSFVAQNLVVAQRSIWGEPRAAEVTA